MKCYGDDASWGWGEERYTNSTVTVPEDEGNIFGLQEAQKRLWKDFIRV